MPTGRDDHGDPRPLPVHAGRLERARSIAIAQHARRGTRGVRRHLRLTKEELDEFRDIVREADDERFDNLRHWDEYYSSYEEAKLSEDARVETLKTVGRALGLTNRELQRLA